MSSSNADPATSAATNAQNGASKQAAAVAEGAAKKASEQNPALRMMGLPRFRLPSRNWMIFWTLSGSLVSAIYYDKWQTKRVKDKWCRLVAPIADEPLDIKTLPRTVTIYLSAPPGDGLRSAREHFHNYVKPILVAAALNWEVIEGRKEGDVRYKTAQSIRDRRKAAGEPTNTPLEEDPIETARGQFGVTPYTGLAGDLVVGRHTWKEYLRGLHEGWLGPIDAPPSEEDLSTPPVNESTVDAALSAKTEPSSENSASVEVTVGSEQEKDEKKDEKKEEKKEDEPPKPRFPPPFMTPETFNNASVPRSIPEMLDPVAPISCPHILGFRNTPIRFYRYLTRRHTADQIGRQVTAAVLGHSRAFNSISQENGSSPSSDGEHVQEQTTALQREERDWWKTVRQPRKEHEESVLIEPIVLNEQITSRMRVFELTAEDEARSKQLTADGGDSSL